MPLLETGPENMVAQRKHVGFTDASILVVGTVRNCATTLRQDVFRLQAALERARLTRWFIVESDSDDETAAVQSDLQASIAGFSSVSLGPLRSELPIRTQRIAHCRNVCVDKLLSAPEYSDVDYVLVADLDGLNSEISADAIESCFVRGDWDVCCANQLGPYYDVFALRHPEWCPGDCWAEHRFMTRYRKDGAVLRYGAVFSKMITIPPDSDWIEVDSAFGGLALYRREFFGQGRYEGLDRSGEEVCEHVAFNRKLRACGARIFINPAMINARYTEHSEWRAPWRMLRREFGRSMRRIGRALRSGSRFRSG